MTAVVNTCFPFPPQLQKNKKKNAVKFYGATFDTIIIFSSNLAGRVPFPLAAADQSGPSFT